MEKRTPKTYRWLACLIVWTVMGTVTSPYAATQSIKPSQGEVPPQGSALLRDALRLYEELEWDRAVDKLNAALTTGLDADDRTEAYWYLAVIARANDELKAAEDYMVEVFRAKPDFTLPETLLGTDFKPLFDAALARVDRTPPEVKIQPLKKVRLNQPIHVVAEISDKSSIIQVVLSYQTPDDIVEKVVTMKQEKENRWFGEIPIAATGVPGDLLLRVSAQDEWQNISTQPATVVISKSGGHGKLYLLGGTIVAIGGGVAAYLLGYVDELTNGGESGPSDNTPAEEAWPRSRPPLPPQ